MESWFKDRIPHLIKCSYLGKIRILSGELVTGKKKKKSITLEITSKRATSKTSRKVDFCCHVLRITKKKKERDSSNTHRLRTGQVPVNTGSKCESKIKWLQRKMKSVGIRSQGSIGRE